ncbi:MAG: hypothetical protein BCS36_04430 [Desulfovibrio sp. MES5]|uniref:EAL domain-containing protein n=1 Tax=Desulfovibrio sp. MES5 TaxID=1899016 RepID=UPI000B9CF747|nr:EAL domain-containing protein [Desulfovibrio sp. MES5]OXS29410.1 MAG: hypothetical protein BCS36_04430 [Desulfovibrio sp. MES5]
MQKRWGGLKARPLTEYIDNNVNAQIVRSVLELSQSLAISVVVEGVEDKEHLHSFTAMGFSTFQGYFFSRPLSAKNCLPISAPATRTSARKTSSPPVRRQA